MAEILAFKPRKKKERTDDNVDLLAEFVREKILANAPSSDIIQFTTKNVCVTGMYIDRSYEEQRLKFFTEDKIMSTSGLVSLMVLTQDASRDALYEIAMIDSLLWTRIPRVERFITAHDGGYEYNFRSAAHDIVQVSFQLLSQSE